MDDDFAPVGTVHLADLLAQLALEQLRAQALAAQLVLEPEHVVHARRG